MINKIFKFFLFLTLLVFIPYGLQAKTNLEKKIKFTSKKLKTFDKKNNTLHTKMAKNAKSIISQQKTLLIQTSELNALKKELIVKESDFKKQKETLIKLQDTKGQLNGIQNSLEQKLIFSIARNLSLSLMLEDERAHNAEALINAEILKQLQIQTKKEIHTLSDDLENNSEKIKVVKDKTHQLQVQINKIDMKKREILAIQDKNKKALKVLKKDKKKYKKEVQKLLNQQSLLKKELSSLHIIKKDKARKAREKKEAAKEAKAQRLAEARRKKRGSDSDLPKIKKHGSSYQKVATKRYRGKKTIAPLTKYKVIKKFGTYTDPIYGIKIFNESVSLKPSKSNAKVRNVLNGKIILVKNTSILKNLIIIEHANNIHTIYAHIDKIAPGIKKGRRVKKGAVLGRVYKELMFEVTQKNYHINPLQMIK